MASADAIETAYQSHRTAIPRPMAVMDDISWSDVRIAQLHTLPHIVVCARLSNGKHQEEVFAWLRDNIGPECLSGCALESAAGQIEWQRGCWDWYWVGDCEEGTEFLFLDSSDAIAFKLRWC